MSGEGPRGSHHIGVLEALEQNGIPIDYVAGTSMGSIIAASMLTVLPGRNACHCRARSGHEVGFGPHRPQTDTWTTTANWAAIPRS